MGQDGTLGRSGDAVGRNPSRVTSGGDLWMAECSGSGALRKTSSAAGGAKETMVAMSTPPPNRRLIAASRAWWSRSIGGTSWRRMRELDLDTHALALCAQQVLCTAPLVVAMSAVVQRLTSQHPGYF